MPVILLHIFSNSVENQPIWANLSLTKNQFWQGHSHELLLYDNKKCICMYNKNTSNSFLTRQASRRGLGVPFATSQAERLFNFDFGFFADHFKLFSLFLFFAGTSSASISLFPVSVSLPEQLLC